MTIDQNLYLFINLKKENLRFILSVLIIYTIYQAMGNGLWKINLSRRIVQGKIYVIPFLFLMLWISM